jgi:hypothetical protein
MASRTVVARFIAKFEFEGGAEYIALCLPAFSPDIVHCDR